MKNPLWCPWRDADRLRRLYEVEELTQEQIADRLGCRRQTVIKWMDEHGIETRSPETPIEAASHSPTPNGQQPCPICGDDLEDVHKAVHIRREHNA